MSILLAILLSALSLSACTQSKVQSLERQNLFRLDIGRLENQIDLLGLEAAPAIVKTRLAMQDGIFYISDSRGQKITRYTSYGDLLSMIYNSDTNPPPFTLKTNVASSEIVTRKAIPYPLIQNGAIAINSVKHVYVEDRLPVDRRTYDPEKLVLYDSTVLHFDQDGNFIDYLGQEGIGGTPFPYIIDIFATYQDEIAVVCRVATGWNVYWFDKNGLVLYVILIRNEDLPKTSDMQGYPSLDSIIVSPDTRRLILKIDYYKDLIDETTKTKTGISFSGSMLWFMNVEDGTYTTKVEIPPYEPPAGQTTVDFSEILYSVIGASRGGKVFLSVPVQGGYEILMMDTESKNMKRGFIQIDPDELAFHSFHLSTEGILSAILATNYEAKVVWWRTEGLIGEIRK
ncbi:MAG: hypothetical protein SNJ56_03090 [Termitinemataceae bacterium]